VSKRAIKRSKGPDKPPDLENLQVTLRYIPHDVKKCDCLKKALTRVEGVTNVEVGDIEARMTFKGDWNELTDIEYFVSQIRCKSALVDPGIFQIDFSVSRQTSTPVLVDAVQKVPGVVKVFVESGRLYVFGKILDVDPRSLQQAVKDAGFRYNGLRSHRFRTLSYEPWEAKSQLPVLRDVLLKNPAVLRVDFDEKAKTVSVLMIKDSMKDPALVTAAEEAGYTLFPGQAEPEDEPTGGLPPTPTQGGGNPVEKK